MLSTEKTKEIVSKYGKSATDTGSAPVQIALLTERINQLTQHFGDHKLDHHSKRGMMKIIGKRRSLLRYLAANDNAGYKKLIKDLGIRK